MACVIITLHFVRMHADPSVALIGNLFGGDGLTCPDWRYSQVTAAERNCDLNEA
jgi:hypothetical protein